MIGDLKNTLKELSFSEKESEVYLAMLELGAASVQDIAKKAGVNRSTTYVMIESLKRRGLISTYEKGKKLFFVAENPKNLNMLLQDEMADLKAKQTRLNGALPQLEAIYNVREDKPNVRFFEGEQALTQMRREVIASHKPIWEFYSVDEPLITTANINEEERFEPITCPVKGRALFSIKPGCQVPAFNTKAFEARVVPYEQYIFSGDLAIVGDKVYLFSMKTIGLTVVLENEEVAEMMRALYEGVWVGATPWHPPETWGRKK